MRCPLAVGSMTVAFCLLHSISGEAQSSVAIRGTTIVGVTEESLRSDAGVQAEATPETTSIVGDEPPFAVPNDNRSPAGILRDGILELDLEAHLARWEGEGSDLAVDARDPSIVTVLGFSEAGGPGDYPVSINGNQDPPAATFRAGLSYRLRFIQITQGLPTDVALTKEGSPLRWRAEAKDGADLPAALRLKTDAEIRMNTGETFDFTWKPEEHGEATLVVRYSRFFEDAEVMLRQTFQVR